jgi:hypothetical protein
MSLILHFDPKTHATCPRFQCDVCGKLITDCSKAVLLWNHEAYDQEFFAGFRLVCKGSCDDHSLPSSMELDTAIAFLLHHSGITDAALEQARKTAKDMGQF